MAGGGILPAELLEEISAIDETQRDYLRNVASHDLYILGKGILGYPDVTKHAHRDFCTFFQNVPEGPEGPILRRLGLMPRGHLKSTLATITDSVRIVLENPDTARVLIANETASTAIKFLTEIKGHFEKNKLLRGLFPELIPSRFSGPGVQWSQDKASINRNSNYKEPSWQAIGVGGAIVGAHFTRIKCDDLIGLDAFLSEAAMKYAIAWNGNIESLLEDHNVDIIDWIGTRWKKNDLYKHIMEAYGAGMAVFTREAIENDQIIFPEKHTWDEYRRIQTNTPLIWFAQYANNPRSEEQQEFPISAVRGFKFSMDGTEVIGNPGLRNQTRWRLDELDIVILVDPNSGSPTAPDTAAIITTGVSPDDEIYVLDAWSGRPSPSGLVDKIYDKARRWKPRAVGIEKAGQQSTQHYFEKKALSSDVSVRIEPLTHGNRDKTQRIRDGLEPIIRSGRLFLLPSQDVLRGAIQDFPDVDIIDELDALAYGPQIWRKPFRSEDVRKSRQTLRKVMARRNPVTGY